jgi:S1-C subfamily serine protease
MVSQAFVASLDNEDKVHDIAVLSPMNTMALTHDPFGFPDAKFAPTAVTFDTRRPRDGDDVFACGYPMGTMALATTAGRIATAWDREVVHTAVVNNIKEETEVYRLDLRINPGNSGGPVFRSDGQNVIGMVIEIEGAPGQWLATAVPSHYITAFLARRGIQFNPSASSVSK